MRNSNGGICYNDIQNMGIADIFEYNVEVASLIEKENKLGKAR